MYGAACDRAVTCFNRRDSITMLFVQPYIIQARSYIGLDNPRA